MLAGQGRIACIDPNGKPSTLKFLGLAAQVILLNYLWSSFLRL